MGINREYFQKVTSDMLELVTKKNSDYGGKIDNISLTGLTGISVRLLDKAVRLYSLQGNEQRKVLEESIKDTLIDIANYAVIGIMLLDNKWNQEK